MNWEKADEEFAVESGEAHNIAFEMEEFTFNTGAITHPVAYKRNYKKIPGK